MQVVVTKHHGLGNDFLVLDLGQLPSQKVELTKVDWPSVAKLWCDRQRGVGADGLLLLTRVDDFKLKMQLFNQDGSRAE
ncbi:MAG: diaminopimelate epimerase, partial [Actinobacteria bacterium]|nr:diaminopimelate epimerase [Actinomycetota bacterium]